MIDEIISDNCIVHVKKNDIEKTKKDERDNESAKKKWKKKRQNTTKQIHFSIRFVEHNSNYDFETFNDENFHENLNAELSIFQKKNYQKTSRNVQIRLED